MRIDETDCVALGPGEQNVEERGMLANGSSEVIFGIDRS
jgi:hypothetical protein